ncbi:ComF family protein [Lentilactobacillus kisonensis]|uniref:ComF family protein n=1 Tax=Lentilactobacillus kisonensis F0435 TaxID=797516 RepID=H1LER6_9LACO|nr:ComF family protein [Lentilactobacillus kisonensis]EHO52271.1 comF family protein [Lentilactobacillus kisonensis F0435]
MKECLLCQVPMRAEVSFDDIILFTRVEPMLICQDCQSAFEKLTGQATCRQCGRRLTVVMENPCYDCQRWQHQISFNFRNVGLYEYNAAMKDYMKRYKFLGDYRLRWLFAKQLGQFALKTKRLLVPIPGTADTMAVRGFNQVTGLLERCHYIEVLRAAQLTKNRRGRKNRVDRLRLSQPFELVKEKAHLIAGKKVALIDDVYTTGTTIRCAATLLYQAGAASVIGITLAR